MTNKTEKFNIRIPDNVSVIYHEKKKTLTFIGLSAQKTLKLKLKLFLDLSKKIIHVRQITFSRISNNLKKKIKALRKTTVIIIEQLLIETSILVYKKLLLNGVGYRGLLTETFNQKLLTLKLGYSHLIYFKIPNNVTITCSTKTKFCIFGNSYQYTSQIAALIRSKKKPEPYKSKGFLYENEKITLKEGKKV